MAGPWEQFQSTGQGPWTQFAPVAPPPPEKQSAFRQVADIPLGIAKGAVQGVRMIADAFGAGSDTSKTIKSAETYLADLMSAQAKNDQQEISRIMKDAEDKGVLDQVKAGIKAFTIAPVDTLSSALGTAAPVIAGALGAKILGAGALVSTGVSALTGAGMGAGVVKGSIYEETKNALKEAGASEQEAEKRAQLAQEYGGKNLDQILLGTVLGGAAAVGPLEKGAAGILARRILGKTGAEATESVAEQAAKGAVRRRLEAGALEAIPEAVQAGQEQVAQNIGLQREGFDVPTFRGAAGAMTLEAIAGAGLGSALGGGKPEVAPAPAPEVPPAPPAPPVGALEFKPEPFIQFPDGTVAKRSEVEAYIKTLPEDQQMAMRAKLLGLAPQEAEKEPAPPAKALEYKPEPLIVYPDGSVAKRSEVDAYIQGLPEDEQIPARAKLLGMGEEATQVTPEMLRKLGIRGRAPIIQRLTGLELTDPKVAEELTNFAQQPFASPEVRGNIFGFLNTIKPIEAPAAPETPAAPPVAPAPVSEAPPVVEPPAPPVTPTVETPAPAAETPAPTVEAAAPVVETAAPTISELRQRVEQADELSEEWQTRIDDLKNAVAQDIKQTLDANEMPVFVSKSGLTSVITPSAQQGGMFQLTRYNQTGAIGDSQYKTIEEAITDNNLQDANRLDKTKAEEHMAKLVDAEAAYQSSKKSAPAAESPAAKPAVEAPAPELTPAEIAQQIKDLKDQQTKLLTKAGKVPAPRSPARQKYDALSAQIADLEGKQLTVRSQKPRKRPSTIMGSPMLAGIFNQLGGLHTSLLSEFSTRFITKRIGRKGKPIVQMRNPLVPGYGTLFNKDGKFDFGEIAEYLEQEGYLEPGSLERDYKDAGERAKDLIKQALNREEVLPIQDRIDRDAQEREASERQRTLDRQEENRMIASGELQLEPEFEWTNEDIEKNLGLDREFETDLEMYDLEPKDLEFLSDEELESELTDAEREQAQARRTRKAEEDAARQKAEGAAPGEDEEILTRPTAEGLRAKQEAAEKAAAEEKKAKAAEQERLRKEQQAKEEKTRADETVKDFELGKSAEEQMTGMGDLFAEPPAPPKREPRQGTPKQLETADGHAKSTGGTVVYQDGDIALVRGFSLLNGQPVYVVTNGDYRSRVDIEGYTGNLVTPEQKANLVKVKQDLEAEDKAKFDKSPSIKFTDGLATSANVSPELAGIVRGWKELLGLKPNLYVTTIDDAVADRNKFTGPHRAVGSAGLDANEAGQVRRLPNGDYYIAFKKGTSKTKMLEVLAHELGHMHEREVYNNADADTKKKIREEHDKWLMSQKGRSARELIQSLRAKTSGKTTRVEKGLSADQMTPYWKSFAEWYADQVSRWAVTSEKPVSVVEKFFSRLAQALKSFYSKLKNAGYLPNETFVQYLEKTHAPSDHVISTDDGSAQQMLGEAKAASPDIRKSLGKATAAAQKALQKQPMPEKGLSHVSKDLTNLAQPIFFPQNKTVLDRIDSMKDRFWQRLAQKTADQFRTIKEYSPLGYMQARLSKSVDGSLEGLLFHGQVFDDGGALNIKKNTKGMMDILKPIGNELDSYLMWVALNRESRLETDRRSKIPNMDKLVARRAEFAAGELNGKPRVEVYQDVLKQMNQLNKSVLDIALAKGLIDQAGYDKFSNDIYYIPFYKKMEEDGTIEGAQTASGLTSQYFSKELKGGEAPFGDLMENIVRNWSHILSASMKNAAAQTTLNDAMELQAAEPNLKAGLEWKDGKVYSTKSGKPIEAKFDEDGTQLYAEGELRPDLTTGAAGMAKVMVNGQPMYFKVTDDLLMDSISSIGYLGPKSKFLDVARGFKNMLQYGVTASPIFKVNNLIRDSVSALAVSDLKKSPVSNVMKGISLSKPDSPTYISALAGGAIFNFGSAYEGDQAKLIKRLIDQGVEGDTILDSKEKITKALKKTWDAYQHLGDRSEAANRLALYQQLRDKGMSHLEASFMARDLLDFSMQGSWPAFRLITQVVPFMNARIQGLYKLGRDGINPTVRVLYNATTGKEIDANDKIRAAQFATVSAAVMLASALLYLTFKDDEDFKKRDAWDRDNFWWFKIPSLDIAFRVPKPFEVGAFGTLVERSLEQILDQGAEGKTFGESLKRTLWDTFALNPTPQMFKPLLDLYANKDSFSGAPIESAGLERLSKQERVTDQTSPLAIALGGLTTLLPEKMEMSPVQVDYAIKGYFGWLGAMASLTSTYAVMPFKEGEYPDARWLDRASLGLVRDLPAPQSAYVTAFYNASKEISQAYADMRHYREMGDTEKVQELLEEKGDKIALAKFYDKTAKNIANVRKQIQLITNDKNLDGAEKKEMIERMKLIMSDLAKQAEEVRKSMKP